MFQVNQIILHIKNLNDLLPRRAYRVRSILGWVMPNAQPSEFPQHFTTGPELA